jgi:diguanylate cyclase (GGDEF)-like protein
MSYRHKILGTSFFAFIVIIGFGNTFSLNATFNEVVLFGNYIFAFSLLVASLAINFSPNKHYHYINYYLPFIGLIFMNQFEGQYSSYLGMPVPITMLVLSVVISLFLLNQSQMNNTWKYIGVIFIGMLITSFKGIDEFLFLGNFLYIAGSIALVFDFKIFSRENYEMQLNEVADLKDNFEYEVKKHAAERTFYMEIQKEKIAEKTRVDNLTRVLNKAGLVYEFSNLIGKNKKFSILMFDIDKFKSVNDTYGHIVGDKCLKHLALTATTSVRKTDIVGRYGGDEFIIILPQSGPDDALKIGEQFRKNVQKSKNPNFTISIGVATYPWDGETMTELIESADKGLYESKENGRNSISYVGNAAVEQE